MYPGLRVRPARVAERPNTGHTHEYQPVASRCDHKTNEGPLTTNVPQNSRDPPNRCN